jgi:mRNA-degrading endonuclease RelE of RelBE toxin-antitoxin system
VSYRIEPTERFQREAKRLAKKFRSIPSELRELSQELEANPHLGTDLGAGIFKIRLAVKSKGKGKSGGGRVVTYVIDEEEVIHLLTIYDKSEFDTIETSELRELVKELFPK